MIHSISPSKTEGNICDNKDNFISINCPASKSPAIGSKSKSSPLKYC